MRGRVSNIDEDAAVVRDGDEVVYLMERGSWPEMR